MIFLFFWFSFLCSCGDSVLASPVVPVPVQTEISSRSELTMSVTEWSDLKDHQVEFSLASLLPTSTELGPSQKVSNAKLFEENEAYRSFVKHVSERIEHLTQAIERDLVVEREEALRYPAGNVGRRFDVRWLRAKDGFFQLVGIVNRLDKMDFYAGKECGELRFIYRLAYRTEDDFASRLPFTVNLVFHPIEKQDCAQEIQKWTEPQSGKHLAALKEQGALDLQQYRFAQMEINAQIVRFPSGLETEFAGQAIYLLRVYDWESSGMKLRLLEVPLENTPDVHRLQNDEALRLDLERFIQKNLKSIDSGVFLLPEHFLAKEALSFSTLGGNRIANKPFSALFSGSTQGRKLWKESSEFQWFASERALIDRLDRSSCMGCHQSKSTAGFHFLGQDDPETSGLTNRLQLPFSEHFHQEQERRRQQLLSFLSNAAQQGYRPHPLRPSGHIAGRNQPCIPEQYRIDFQDSALWSCSEQETCQIVADQDEESVQFGQCLPKKEALQSGNTCRKGAIKGSLRKDVLPFNLHSYSDSFSEQQIYSLPEDKYFSSTEYNCRPTRIGVPLGRTYRKCSKGERHFEGFVPAEPEREICAVVGGSQFDSCVERNFHDCLDGIVSRGMVDTCSLRSFCREDYICQALPHQLLGTDGEKARMIQQAGIGFCTPNYFVFQLRLDGHPIPTVDTNGLLDR